MDMRSSLGLQRMQLSDDPDDWVWGRWFWAQPGAKPFARWNAFCHPLWDGEEADERQGPGFFLAGGLYRKDATSPYPGQNFHGLPEWYENGLPLDVRVAETVQDQCGGEAWDTNVNLSLAVHS